MLKGKSVYLVIAPRPTSPTSLRGLATNHSLQIQNQLSAIDHKDAATGVVTNEMTGKSWNMSSDNLMNALGDNSAIETYLKEGTEVTAALMCGSATICTGKAVVTSIQKNFPNKDNSTYSVSIQGVEQLSLTEAYAKKVLEKGVGVTINETQYESLSGETDNEYDFSNSHILIGSTNTAVKYDTYSKYLAAKNNSTAASLSSEEYNLLKGALTATQWSTVSSKLTVASGPTIIPPTVAEPFTGQLDTSED